MDIKHRVHNPVLLLSEIDVLKLTNKYLVTKVRLGYFVCFKIKSCNMCRPKKIRFVKCLFYKIKSIIRTTNRVHTKQNT